MQSTIGKTIEKPNLLQLDPKLVNDVSFRYHWVGTSMD